MKIIIEWSDLIDLVSHLKQMPTGYIKFSDFGEPGDFGCFEFHSPVHQYIKYYEMEVVKED